MNSFVLPPTPNWYDIGVAACAPDNTYLYASLGDLVVVQPNSTPNLKILYKMHKDRITCININPEWGNPDKFIVTTGKDKNVKVYDVNTWRSKASHAGHTTRNEKVIGATFCGNDRIISVSESGFIILWKISNDDMTSLADVLTLKDKITCMSACPHQYGMVAFGYSKGTILVTDLRNKGHVMYRLIKHDTSIVDLAWCPTPYNIFTECNLTTSGPVADKENQKPLVLKAELANKVKEIDALNSSDIVQTDIKDDTVITETQQLENSAPTVTSKEYLLASSALGDSKIIIWRAFTNGIKQIELRLAKPYSSGKRYHSKPEKDHTWISLSWVGPTTLLSSSAKSELLQWNFTSGLINGLYKSILVHNEHKSSVFSIKAPIKLFKTCSPTTWHETPLPAAWTLSRDRLVINAALSPSCEILTAYPTIAGQVTILSTSKINPARLAISTSEDTCRLMDLSSSDTKIIIMNSFEKLSHKISAMTWHPKNENLLTFGTFDGQVGSVDACQLFKPCNYYVQYRNALIVTLDWGPTPENSDVLGLYAVLYGELVMFDPNKPFAYPKVLLDAKSWVSYVAWKPDYEICAVGNKFGHVSFFNKKFECLTTTYVQSKQIRSLCWHPNVTGEDLEISPCNHWLAASANDIVVYDLEEINFGKKIEDREKQVRVVAKFTTTAKSVMNIDWSPHENGKLVATTDVTFLTVWNVKTKEVVASIKAEQFSIFSCVIWSPVHEDFIITGGKGNTLRYWKVSENLSSVMGTKLAVKSQNGTNDYHEVINVDSDTEAIDKLRNAKIVKRSKCILALSAQNHNSSDNFGMTKVCEKLFDMRENPEAVTASIGNDDIDITKLFGTRDDIADILKMEVDYHSNHKYTYAPNHISLWEGSIEDQISKAINSDTVTSWHVNMAPLVSHQFWRSTCEAYAKQLAEEGPNSVFESSSYFLACNKITEAIDVLCEHNKHREALALAKMRLVPEDSRITEIYEKFAKFSEESGNYEIAAQCYIVLGSTSNALKALLRRTHSNRESLEFCIRLAQHSGEKEILSAVQIRLEELEKISPKAPEMEELPPLLKRVDLELALHEKELELQANPGMLSSKTENEIVTAYNQRSTNIQDTLQQRLDQISKIDEEEKKTEESKCEDVNDIQNQDETKIEIGQEEMESDPQKEDEININGEEKEKENEMNVNEREKEDEPDIQHEDVITKCNDREIEDESDTPKEDKTIINGGEEEDGSKTPKEDETNINGRERESDIQNKDETKISNEENEKSNSLKDDETKVIEKEEKIDEVEQVDTSKTESVNVVQIDTASTHKTDDSKVKDQNRLSPSNITDCDANAKQEISEDAV